DLLFLWHLHFNIGKNQGPIQVVVLTRQLVLDYAFAYCCLSVLSPLFQLPFQVLKPNPFVAPVHRASHPHKVFRLDILEYDHMLVNNTRWQTAKFICTWKIHPLTHEGN
ncbi:unnamed protein product, partial [Prunus brigantina]